MERVTSLAAAHDLREEQLLCLLGAGRLRALALYERPYVLGIPEAIYGFTC